MPVQKQEAASVVSLSVDDPVYKRAEVFSLYLAKRAAEASGVKQFRQGVLDGGTISYEEALAFVDSPAAAIFSLEWFEESGVPLIGHKAQVMEGEWPLSVQDPKLVCGSIKVEWDSGELVTDFQSVAPLRSLEARFVRADMEYYRELEILEDSVLGVLWNLTQGGIARFPGWEPLGIPGFVLTGVAPNVATSASITPRSIHSSRRRRSVVAEHDWSAIRQ
jgi:hypothetical protein